MKASNKVRTKTASDGNPCQVSGRVTYNWSEAQWKAHEMVEKVVLEKLQSVQRTLLEVESLIVDNAEALDVCGSNLVDRSMLAMDKMDAYDFGGDPLGSAITHIGTMGGILFAQSIIGPCPCPEDGSDEVTDEQWEAYFDERSDLEDEWLTKDFDYRTFIISKAAVGTA